MTPSKPAPDPRGISCDEAFELARVFAAKELPRAERTKLRTHLTACPECMDRYRQTVSTTAVLGRTSKAQREERAIERQRRALHAQVFGPPPAEGKPIKKARNFRLRMMILPALFFYLITQITGLGPPPARVLVVESSGLVTVDDRRVEEATESTLVLPGRWVQVGRFASARLDGRSCFLDLDSSTDILVEAAAPPRFRLRRGAFDLEGTTTLITVLGLLEVEEGRGRLRLDDRGLELEPQSGRWTWFDKGGEKLLENGRAVTIRPDVDLVGLRR